MRTMTTGHWAGTRANGRPCTIYEVSQFESHATNTGAADATYLHVDHEPATRLYKGRYRIDVGDEAVTSDDPAAP